MLVDITELACEERKRLLGMSNLLPVQKLIREKCRLYVDHPDTVAGHITQERALTNDYRGRVLYELLQNAVDRAESRIWVSLDRATRTLTVANDGRSFSNVARDDESRSDLAALCSINTSNKKAGESIGNKGVGFKSVWEFCHSIQVRSRTDAEDPGWGIRLRWPFQADHLHRWHDRESALLVSEVLQASAIEAKYRGQAPSFYFPQYLPAPAWVDDGAVTAVVLEELTDADLDRLESGLMEDLLKSTLVFVCDIRKDGAELQLMIRDSRGKTVVKPLHTHDDQWMRIDIDTSPYQEELDQCREQLGFELEGLPRLTLGFWTDPKDDRASEGRVHGYLPTEVTTGSPLHIQGDFYLSESRKHIDFANNHYNRLLLRLAVSTLCERLASGEDLLASLPFALELLASEGVVGRELDRLLRGQGAQLAAILSRVIGSRDVLSTNLIKSAYSVMERYMPRRLHGEHTKTFESQTLKLYFRAFSHADLPIVPLEFEPALSDDSNPVIKRARTLPLPRSEAGAVELFCRQSSSIVDRQTIDVPGLSVTDWRFPSSGGLARDLRALGVWREFEPTAVLRAVVRQLAQAEAESARLDLLATAAKLYAPVTDDSRTRWHFLSDEVHPSQRLLIPICGGGRWAEARHCYLTHRHPILDQCLDLTRVFKVDEELCERALGLDYARILKSWGVWDAVPLVLVPGTKKWMMPIASYPNGQAALRLFADSLMVWERGATAVLDAVLDCLRKSPWLVPASGSNVPVAPVSVYFGQPAGNVLGLYLISADSLGSAEIRLLERLGVQRIEKTDSAEKLVSTLEAVAEPCCEGALIKGPVVSAYRKLVLRVNQLLHASEVDIQGGVLDRIPLLCENNFSKERTLHESESRIWYIPEDHRAARRRLNNDKVWCWLAPGDVATLARSLSRVEVLKIKSKIVSGATVAADATLRNVLERDYLPMLMAIALYGDIPGSSQVDESDVQARWQGLTVYSSVDGELHEALGVSQGPVKQVVTRLSENLLIWESRRTDQKKNLFLYAWRHADRESAKFKREVCRWFAEEIFRRRELTTHFERFVLNDEPLEELDISQQLMIDARELVHGWLPDDTLKSLLDVMREVSGLDLSTSNWRDVALWREWEGDYRKLLSAIPPELAVYLKPLNPSDLNLSALKSFLEAHAVNLAALPSASVEQDIDWLDRLEKSPEIYSFCFDPEVWFLGQLQMTKEDFDSLAYRLDYEVREIGARAPIAGAPGLAELPRRAAVMGNRSSSEPPPNRLHLSETKDDDVRAKQDLVRAENGKSVEKRLAIEAARRIAAMDVDHRSACHSLVLREYHRLAEKADLAAEKLLKQEYLLGDLPYTERQWLEILHVAERWDGSGYDYLDFDATAGKLLLVEAKESQRRLARVYLSENERQRIVEYASSEFSAVYPWAVWRLYLVIEGRPVDATNTVVGIVQKHAEAYRALKSSLMPEGWLIDGLRVGEHEELSEKLAQEVT